MDLPVIVERYIEAYNRLDVPEMLACLSERVVFRNIAGGAVNAETAGKPAFAELAAVGAAAFSQRRQVVTQAIVMTGRAMLAIDYSARVARDLPNGWTAGQALAFAGRSYMEWDETGLTLIVDEM